MKVNGFTLKDKVGHEVSLDDAMLETGFGIYNIGVMLLSGLILMGMIMETAGLSFIIPAAQCDLELTLGQKGLLAAIPFIAIILTSHMWGWLADTRGRRPVMLLSMLAAVVFSVLSSFAPNLAVFATLQFIACIFISGPSGVVYAYLGEFNSVQHRDKMVAFGAAFVGIGTVLLPCVSWLILPLDFAYPVPLLGIYYRPWRLLVVAFAIPYALACVLLLFAPESPKFLNATGQYDRCLKLLRKMNAVNRRVDLDDYPVKALHEDPSLAERSTKTGVMSVLVSMRDQTAPLFKPPLVIWTALACFVQFGIMATANGFYVWFPTILNALANHEGAETSICNVFGAMNATTENTLCDDTVNTSTFERAILTGLVFCSVYVIVGVIVDFVGKKVILVFILLVAGACGIASSLVHSQMLAIIFFAVFQMSGACIGLLNAVVVELFPTKLRAMAVCLSLMMGRVGSVLGSNIIGLLLQSRCTVAFYIFGGLLIVSSAVCLTLPGKQNKAKVEKLATTEPAHHQTQEPA